MAGIAFDYCKRIGTSQQASIWGTDDKASVPMAAFTNGLLAHALDFDDWDAYLRAGHPTSMITRRHACAGREYRRIRKRFVQSLCSRN